MFDLPPITHFRHAGTSEVASTKASTLFRLRGLARHAAFLGLCVGILDPQPNRIEDHYSIISSATASTPSGTPSRRGRFSLTSPARPRATLSRPPARDAVASATGLRPTPKSPTGHELPLSRADRPSRAAGRDLNSF